MQYKRIKNLRVEHHYTEKEVAEFIAVSESVYFAYEEGSIEIPIEIFIKLADFYNTNIEYILERSERKERI